MSAPVFDPDCEGGERCTCRRAEVLDTPTARLIAAARQCVRVWRPGRDSEGDGIVGEMMSALRDLDAAYIDEPVGITADIVVAEACGRPGCEWRERLPEVAAEYPRWGNGRGWVNAPDEVCPPCDELRVIRDAFRAGAEYMRRSTSARVEPPGPHWARITAPDAERVDAAAAGYVEGLVG